MDKGTNQNGVVMEFPDRRTMPEASKDKATGQIEILIADAVAITCELLKQALIRQPDFAIAGCARNMEELAELMTDGDPPQVALIQDSGAQGTFAPVAILERIHELSPGTRSIVLSSGLSREEVIAYFHAQARGILPADQTDFATMCKCIHAVAEGQIWASNEQVEVLIESLAEARPLHVIDEKGAKVLSARETEVLALLAEGRSNRSMAEVLRLSEHTIKNHLFHIFDKLGVSSRTEAVLYAMRQSGFSEQKRAS